MASWRDHKLRSFPPCVVNHWTFRLQVGMKLFLVGWNLWMASCKTIGLGPQDFMWSDSFLGCRCLPFAAYLLMNDLPFMLTFSKYILENHDSIQAASCSKARFVLFCCRFHRDLYVHRAHFPMVHYIMFHIKIAALDWHVLVFSMFRHTEVSHLF